MLPPCSGWRPGQHVFFLFLKGPSSRLLPQLHCANAVEVYALLKFLKCEVIRPQLNATWSVKKKKKNMLSRTPAATRR